MLFKKPNVTCYRALSIVSVCATLILTGACESPQLIDKGKGLGAGRTAVGGGIYTPANNLGQPIAEGRSKPIFAHLDEDECVVQDHSYSGDSTGKVHTWTSSSSYYNYLKSDTNISGSLANAAVMKASLEAVANQAVTIDSEIAGSAYEYFAYKKLFALTDDCESGRFGKGSLAPDLLASFNNDLVYPVQQPDKITSWTQYDKFLRTYGTHYVDKLKTGVRYRRYTFLRTYKSVKASSLAVTACVAAEGATPEGKVSIQGCQGIDQKTRNEVNLSDFTDEPSAFGGNERIRNELSGGATVTPELLADFADTADVDQDGVQYNLAPIWQLLYDRATNEEDRNKALTLQAYFEGFVASNCNQVHGCGCSRAMDRKNNVLLRKFVQTATSPRAVYQCQRPATGCRNNDDCHYNLGKAYCQCYGDHCVNTASDKISAVVNFSSKITGKNKGPNRSCTFGGSLTCSCARPKKGEFWSTLWKSQ